MHPAYGYHQPFPLPKDQNPYPYYHYPSWEAVPPHMKSDDSSRLPSVGPWASNSSFGHSIPTDHNHCCSHSYPPGYYSLRPPYSPIQPPPQPYYYGPYPPYPDFSPSYFVPPPHYSVDQSRYDYDKAKEHCCGCPNHVCHPKEARGTSLRIEEQKPEEEEEHKEGRLIRQQHSPPRSFFWIPHDSNKRKPSDDKSELHPSPWNGWIPLDLNNLKGMMQGGGNEKTAEEFPPKFKIIPLKFLENGSHEDKPGVVGDAQPENQSCNGTKAKAKAIPVLLDNGGNNGRKPGGVAEARTKKDQVHSIGELEKETNAKAKTKTIPVRQMEEANVTKSVLPEKEMGQSRLEENEEKKASGIKAVSVKKPSKLPPVCLRVDPLPKKKAGNGSSRSSSPSGWKEERAHQEKTEQKPKDMNAREQKKDVKVIKVLDAASDSSSKPEAVPVVPLKNAAGRDGAEIVGKDEDKKRDGEKKNSGVVQEEPGEGKMTILENKVREEGKESRRNLSQSEAAVLIQSAYRGFEVRRWQPLEKLQKIGRIREQATDIERQIESLQASSEELDSKQRVVIGEAIMNLLLQLDTIQGLHSSVRETRKAVARYLICLQEKLDSLGSQATTDEPSQNEQDSTKKSPIDESAKSLSSTLETEQVPEKESAQPLEQGGLAEESSFGLDRGTENDDKKHAEAKSGNGEAVDTPAKSLEPLPPAFIDYEEQKEARLVNDENMENSCTIVNDENMENSCTTEESAQLSGVENMTSIDVVHDLAVQELPELQELNCQESRTVEAICDAAMKDEGMTMKEVSDPAVKDEISDATTVLEESLEKEFNQKDERLGVGEDAEGGAMEGEDELPVPPLQLISKSGGVVEDAEEAATEGEIIDATIEYESNAGVDQRKSLETSLEDTNKLREEDVVARADETDPGYNIQVSAALSEEEDRPDVKEHPLVFMEEGDHVNETSAFSGVDNSRGLEVSQPEQMQCNVVASVGNNQPLQKMVENVSSGVTESSEEDGHEDAANEGIEYIDAGAVVESAPEETASPISNGVPEPSKIATAFEADSSELIGGEDASSAAHNVKTGSEGVCTLELSNKEKQLAEENEKLRKMLENLLEAGRHQLGVISELNGRVTELEKRLTKKKKKVRVGRNKAGSASPCTENEDRISRRKTGSSAARIKC